MNCEPLVIDDDDIVEVAPADIIIDVDNPVQSSRLPCTIDLDDEPSSPKASSQPATDNNKEKSFAMLLKNNTLMNKIVRRSLNMQNNAGMSRIIQKTVLSLYKDASNSFKESETFTKVLIKILHSLKNDPDHKFLHIKLLCEELKAGKYRRKVPFVTLTTELDNLATQNKFTEQKQKSKFNKTGIIDLENSDDDNIILLDEDANDDDIMIVDETKSNEGSELSNKENKTGTNDEISVPNYDHLVPNSAVDYCNRDVEDPRIAEIEKEIAFYKDHIKKLEEIEVTDFSNNSPYLQCDRYKAKIVRLYKKLCRITGNSDGDLWKRRKVRLRYVEGQPLGPVKRLEALLNEQMKKTGVVPLPDFQDVVDCVTKSNIEDNLGYSKQEIMREAIALFTHCGHALRKRRQKQEYKDLLSLVQDKERQDHDPANEDPQLLQRLEENKRIAKVNEDEILERFVKLERGCHSWNASHPSLSNATPQRSDVSNDEDSDTDNDEDRTTEGNKSTHTPTVQSAVDSANTNTNINNVCTVQEKLTSQQVNATANTTCPSLVIVITPTQNNTVIEKCINITTSDNCETSSIKSTKNVIIGNSCENKATLYETHNFVDTSTENSLNKPTQCTSIITILPNSGTTPQFDTPTPHIVNITHNESEVTPRTDVVDSWVSHVNTETQIENTRWTPSSEAQAENATGTNATTTQTENNCNAENDLENVIKKEPIDIQSLLDQLGDNYISTIFDIEDPFVVIDISSDSSDDDL